MSPAIAAALLQAALTLFGVSAIVMAMSNRPVARKWAPVVGLCGQPFWVAFAWQAGAWGVMALTCAFTCAYLVGLDAQWHVVSRLRR